MNAVQIKELSERIRNNISKVIVGKEDVINKVLTALFCSGHVLLEDVPGTGKTSLAKSLSKSINCNFKRIQFTPDLLPSDLTGINYYNQKQQEFVFREGPIFANIVLADEINRATPRTQSSLLECMEECQVTIDGVTKQLARPFFVIATQNPVEIQGTFPLPEAQLDRFFMRLKIGYPTTEEGKAILDRFQKQNPLPTISSVAGAEEIIEVQDSISQIEVSDDIKKYIIDIVEATRNHEKIVLGISPRGSIALMRGAQAYAAINGRDFVTPDDIKYIAPSVLAHRIILRSHAITSGAENSEAIIREILDKVPVPIEE
ncbi:MAG TPA: MoxR family ATPase [Clostridiaceae bacterium]|nr:MoxR family ATPase [Clostridiaceae bacterium]